MAEAFVYGSFKKLNDSGPDADSHDACYNDPLKRHPDSNELS